MNVPNLRHLADCVQNEQTIVAALNRYATKYNQYPEKLESLYPRFIEDRKVLHCPSDPRPTDIVSYEYHRPKIDSPDSTVLVTCSRHTPFRNLPSVIVGVRKDGTQIVSQTESHPTRK
jgi:hypothetical protein